MDGGYVLTQENPRNRAGIFSKLFFVWMVKLCYKGTKTCLTIGDLYKTSSYNQSEQLTDKLERNWNDEVAKAKLKIGSRPSLTRAIIKTFFWRYMALGILLFLQMTVLRPFQPVVLAGFIKSFTTTDNYDEMYIYGTVLVLQSFFIVVSDHHLNYAQSAIGMRIRIAVSSLIYRKMLKLSKSSLEHVAAGKIVNLLSNDVNRFDLVIIALHYFWIMPFQAVFISFLIWRVVGVSAFAGVLLMLSLIIPIQGYLGRITKKLRLKTALRTDHRIKLMNEVIIGIQIIKMYAWEKAFAAAVRFARKAEIKVITLLSYLRGIHLSCIVFMERTTLFLTVVCYVLLGNTLTADKVFSLAQLFNQLQLSVAILFPMAIAFGAETIVSIKRLREFLVLEEIPESPVQKTTGADIVISHVNAAWSSQTKPIFENLSLTIPSKSLCAVVGPVGCGKSSILQLLLGEMAPTTGDVKVGGTISYCSQEPWLFAATVRNNILFGQEYDKLRYSEVVEVCCLLRDFELLPHGDKTVVGERGVALSGGQRARINLARAIYAQADIYLLDDPLSAVDTHVGKYLFEECIMKYLENKTRILVTHQLQFLKRAHHIVVVENGQVEVQGSFDDIIRSDISLTKLLVSETDEGEKTEIEGVRKLRKQESMLSSHKSLVSERSDSIKTVQNEEEMREQHSSPFKAYIKASGSIWSILGLLFLLILAQAANTAADYWVAIWTQDETLKSSIPFYTVNRSNNWYEEISYETETGQSTIVSLKRDISIYIYTAIIGAAIVLTLIRSIAYFKMTMTASKNLHNQIFEALIRAPLRFFNMNPSGRVLNRFSKDMGAVDEMLPRVLADAIQILLVMSGILVTVALANYYMVIVMVLFAIFFVKLRGWYIATAKDIKHLEGIAKSNVFSHLNSSLGGVITIRASKAEPVLVKQFDGHQDTHTSAWFLTIATRVCFGLWLDLLSVLFVGVVAFSFIILSQFASISESLIGLALSQSLILNGMLQIGMRQTAEVVNQLTSVERIMQYTKLEDEHDTVVSQAKSKRLHWPSKGLIEFENMSLKYSDDDAPVLCQITVTINPGDKIGIMGRTGAGKSSLIAALFRLAPTEGIILIDGVNTKTVPLDELRKNISIIPQEPILFSGTLRYNLDPFHNFEDKALWDVLEQIELKDKIDNLDSSVSEGGSNFSVGQKQLLCLGRAILRNNKILVMDEATANVDQRTDSLIQNTIKAKFGDCTVLTIAHRLNTIMDSDKIMVVDAGRVVEFDKPSVLLQNTDGFLSKMVAETGPVMAEQLKQISYDSLSRHNNLNNLI